MQEGTRLLACPSARPQAAGALQVGWPQTPLVGGPDPHAATASGWLT